MNQQLLAHVAAKSLREKTPEISAGMTVKVSQKIREGEKERVQNFEGLVIATSGGKGVAATFTVRRIVGAIGVEKVFPLHGKNVVKIEIIKKAKVRRSKLYYSRGLRGKAARMSETYINEVAHDEAEIKNEKVKMQNENSAESKVAETEKVENAETEKPEVEKVEAEPQKKEEQK